MEKQVDEQKIEKLTETTTKMIRLMGYREPSVQYIQEKNRLAVFINSAAGRPLQVREELRGALEYIIKQIARTIGVYPVYVDINNYHAKREKLIVKLAKAAARKVNATKDEVHLPPMNSYERRLVHVELSMRPDVETESEGERKDRHVVVKPFE